jgi:uncharacterized membrane protein
LEALSDGVIAIAITLLIIEVAVPHVEGEQSLGSALWDQWPSYFGFVLSFATIGIMWMNHHQMFRDIERVDHGVLVLNLLLLMGISFVPFPTAVLAEYLRDEDQRLTATLLYGGTFTFTALWFNVLWLYSSRVRGLLDPRISTERIAERTRRYRYGPFLYGIGLPLALISPWLTLTLYVLLALLYVLPQRET